MSEAMVAEFTKRAASLSNEETIFVISILLEKLKAPATATTKNSSLDNIFNLADKLHLNSAGKSWTREELYDR